MTQKWEVGNQSPEVEKTPSKPGTMEYEIEEKLELCHRCHCCSTYWKECDYCGGEGVSGHDCGEDSCCCLDPEDNIVCDICGGDGGWTLCIGNCDEKGRHRPHALDKSEECNESQS